MTSSLSHYLQKARAASNLSNLCILSCGLLLVFALISEWQMWSQLQCFAHDELTYIGDYKGKLATEGRWLNYLLFPILRLFNGHIVSLVNAGCLFVFSWVVCRRFLSPSASFVAALVTLTFPPVHAMNYWATTMLPSYIVVLCAALLYNKTPKWLLLLGSAILLNGGLATFYFFIPVLYLGEEKRSELLKTILWWIVAFVVGVAFAELFTFARFGHLIQPASYRHFHLVTSISDAQASLHGIKASLSNTLVLFKDRVMMLLPFVTLCLLYEIITKKRKNNIYAIILLSMVAMSVYAHAFVGSLFVASRSSICLFFAVFLLFAWSVRRYPLAVAAVSVIFASQMLEGNANDIQYWNTLKTAMVNDMSALPYNPREIKRIVFVADEDNYQRHINKLAEFWRLKNTISRLDYRIAFLPIILKCGYLCPHVFVDEDGVSEEVQCSLSSVEFRPSGMFMHARVGDILLLKFP